MEFSKTVGTMQQGIHIDKQLEADRGARSRLANCQNDLHAFHHALCAGLRQKRNSMQFSSFAAAIAVSAALAIGLAVPSPVSAQPKATSSPIEAKIRACLAEKSDSSPSDCIGIAASPCMETDDGSSTVGMAECMRTETAAWDSILNTTYRSLMKNPAPGVRNALREAQRAWMTSRDKTCAIYGAQRMADQNGTMAIIQEAGCVLDETGRRAIWLTNLEGWE
jgi:uncharacterized protein YecT (DUF1311 family)